MVCHILVTCTFITLAIEHALLLNLICYLYMHFCIVFHVRTIMFARISTKQKTDKTMKN